MRDGRGGERAGLDPHRVAEVIVTGPAGTVLRRGSGYRVTTDAVLTAAHVVADATTVTVRFDGDRPEQCSALATVRWCDGTNDVAVLRIAVPPGAPEIAPPGFARLTDRQAVLGAHAAGFPRWKLRTRSDGSVFREMHHASGSVSVYSNWREQTIELTVDPAGADPEPSASPWEGMSGAAVWAGERIIGIVTRHSRREGPGRLYGIRLDRCLASGTPRDGIEFATLLGIPGDGTLPDAATPSTGWLDASGYREVVRDIAPRGGLLDREAELDELIAFCAGDEPYLWWQGEPWAGKSALMSTFVLNPPAGLEVVSFFVTGRLAAESDSDAFTGELLGQLAHASGDSEASLPGGMARDRQRRRLLAVAARTARAAGRRLVLVVDGLDEDCGARPGSGLPSIASLLPKVPADGLRIIVTSRPDPPLPSDVPLDHPLRSCRVRRLTPSRHAAELARQAQRELDELLTGEPIHRELLGLIIASGGGLGLDELEELTGQPRDQLTRLLAGVFGRTIGYRADASSSDAPPGLLFTHETLRVEAAGRLGRALSGYRNRIDAWADGYHRDGWPENTPAYLWRGYPRLLVADRDVERLLALATDRVRHDRLLGVTGGDAAALGEISAVEQLIHERPDPDLSALLRLAIDRDRLVGRNFSVPDELPLLWAELGFSARAEAMALSWTRGWRSRPMLGLARHFIDTGEHGRAIRLATAANRSWTRDVAHRAPHDMLETLFDALMAGGELDRAEQVVRDGDVLLRQQLVRLMTAMTAAGEHDRVTRLVEADEDPTNLLSKLARELARTGDHRSAVAVANKIGDPFWRDHCLTTLVRPLVQAGQLTAADGLADLVPEGHRREGINTELVVVLLEGGAPERAVSAVGKVTGLRQSNAALAAVALTLAGTGSYFWAETVAGQIGDPGLRAQTLRIVAGMVLRDGSVGSADAAVTAAMRAATLIWERSRQDEALLALVRTLIEAGALDRAEEVAKSIVHPSTQVTALTGLIRAVGASGGTRRIRALAIHARTSALAISGPLGRVSAGANLAAALVETGELGQAEKIVRGMDASDAVDAAKTVIGGLAVSGEFDRAERLARDISGRDGFRPPLAELARVFAMAGECDRVQRVVESLDGWARSESLRAVVRGYAEVGAYEQARRTADTLDSGARAEALVDLGRALAAAGHRGRAVEVATEAGKLGKSSSPYRRGWALTAVCKALIVAGRFDHVPRYLSAIDDPLNQPHRLANEIAMLTAAGDHDRAVQAAGTADAVLASMSRADGYRAGTSGPAEAVGLLARAMRELVAALFGAGDRFRAERAALAVHDPDLRPRMRKALVEGLVAVGDSDRAEQVARDVSVEDADSIYFCSALTAGIRAFAAVDDRDRVVALTAVAVEAAASLVPGPPNFWVHEIASLLGKIGEPALAERFVRALPDPLRAGARSELILGLVAGGNLEAAGDSAAGMNPGRLGAALTEALVRSAAAGQYDRADGILDRIDDARDRALALIAYAAAVASTGDRARARALVTAARSAVAGSGWDIGTERLAPLAGAALASGDIRTARRLAAEVLLVGDWQTALPTLAEIDPGVLDTVLALDMRVLTA